MKSMSVIIAERAGPPDVLQIVDRPIPIPKAGEILIKVAAAGVNRPDLMQRSGMPLPSGAPDVYGLEAAGVVEAVGEDVTAFQPGDRVMALLNGGGYATHCLALADHCLPVPPCLTLVQAAALPEALFTIWHNLYERGRLAPGETLLIHGGASGLGTLAVALATATGARVVATAGNVEKVKALQTLGATLAIHYREEDFVAVIRDQWGENAIDVVLDTVGGDYIARNLEVMAPDGRHVSLSFFQGAEVTLDLPSLMRKGLTMTSSTLRPKSSQEKSRLAACVAKYLLPLIANGRVLPTLHAQFDLRDAAEAHRTLEENRNIGKVLLTTTFTEET